MKCKHGIKDCKNDGKEEICGACNIKDFMGAPEYEPEKENANSGYPLLADVLAEIDKKDLSGGGGVLLVFKRDDLKEVLSKYFS